MSTAILLPWGSWTIQQIRNCSSRNSFVGGSREEEGKASGSCPRPTISRMTIPYYTIWPPTISPMTNHTIPCSTIPYDPLLSAQWPYTVLYIITIHCYCHPMTNWIALSSAHMFCTTVHCTVHQRSKLLWRALHLIAPHSMYCTHDFRLFQSTTTALLLQP